MGRGEAATLKHFNSTNIAFNIALLLDSSSGIDELCTLRMKPLKTTPPSRKKTKRTPLRVPGVGGGKGGWGGGVIVRQVGGVGARLAGVGLREAAAALLLNVRPVQLVQ